MLYKPNHATCTFSVWFHSLIRILILSTLLCVSIVHSFSWLSSTPFHRSIPPIKMRRLRFRKVKWCAQSHLAGKWWTWIQAVASRASLPNSHLWLLSNWATMPFSVVGFSPFPPKMLMFYPWNRWIWFVRWQGRIKVADGIKVNLLTLISGHSPWLS